MEHFIIETCWMNKGRNIGLKEYYEVIKKACKERDGVEFLGLYRPLNNGWNWAYFLKTDSLDKWLELENEINKMYINLNDNVASIVTRIYEGSDQYKQPPMPKKRDSWIYFIEEIQNWTGLDVGLREYYSSTCELFEGVEDGWFFGLYAPWSEGTNWVLMYMFDSMSRFFYLMTEWLKRHGRPENMTNELIRIYKRFEP